MQILVTRKVDEEYLQPFYQRGWQVEMWHEADHPMPRTQLLESIRHADGLFTNLADPLDQEIIAAGKKLKVISTMAVGFDNIHIPTAIQMGIPVGYTPGVLTEATADLTFALLMATARRIVEGAEVVREKRWPGWGPFYLTGQPVYGRTIGIIGMGRIGEAVARRARGFQMPILYHNRKRRVELEHELGAMYVGLEELLSRSDYVVLLAPATKETYHLMGRDQFKLMKKSAIFINVSRGQNVDEMALYEALAQHEIWAAGLDVYQEEPLPADHPFRQLPNLLMLPHIGSAEIDTREAMVKITVENICRGLVGEPLLYTANPQVYER
ncbi:2-hydroxyacid dehydrogenase [Rubeoparvulum massiliense]|uniref:2-hydroxyacid dehydrogenase n=1 Tax=Rubeoparvulum massiliense TaxID=1631346 RepID=UPI00065E1CAB|nr:D-glycerate dehydrogenase [Rubeoparvulum massiliense]